MTADAVRVQQAVRLHLENRDLSGLFLSNLRWDSPDPPQRVAVGGLRATQIADKRGVGVWLVTGSDSESFDTVDRQIAQRSHERLVVWDKGDGSLTWSWPERRRSGYVRRRRLEQRNAGEVTDVVQRLASLRFESSEEAALTVLDVRDRVRRSFDSEKVTDEFFREFKACHELIGGTADGKVAGALSGIGPAGERRWYASVLLNRLMFLYFLEKKGFLDNDTHYLRNRLAMVEKANSNFYEDFLSPLFHDAIGRADRSTLDAKTRSLIGDVPYLNGGVFALHPLEAKHAIGVPNRVFDQVFQVFEKYRWHLDDRETASGEEISPDILGHIFERYVNQREAGAYYTPDDTTGWMARGSVGVVLLERLVLLGVDLSAITSGDPRRYVPEEMLFGEGTIDLAAPYPAPGSEEGRLWDKAAPPDVALPDENLWEVRDRLRGGLSLVDRLQSGAIATPGDAFDAGLDLIQLLEDCVHTLTPKKLDLFWRDVENFTVLDPTCGSGAFLLAAMDLLEDVAELVVARANELASIAPTDLSREMAAVPAGRQRLHIREHVVLASLFGTDLAAEAVDIARLRLYLALVAVMYDRRDLRPLPDLEFNLAPGNLLVGVNTPDELQDLVGGALWAHDELDRLKVRLTELAQAIQAFRAAQGRDVPTEKLIAVKEKARRLADGLSGDLDAALHKASARDVPFETWRRSHQPMHVIAEFPEVMASGGFDVVIGNPPYVKRSNAVARYRFDGFETSETPDIFAPCTERALSLVRDKGVLAFVLPLSSAWSDDYQKLRAVLSRRGQVSVACFGRNPDAIFRGIGIRNAITFVRVGAAGSVRVTAMHRWTARFRPALFGTVHFEAALPEQPGVGWPRLGTPFAITLWSALRNIAKPAPFVANGRAQLYSKKTALYWLPVSPRFLRTIGSLGGQIETEKQMRLDLDEVSIRDAAFAVFASKLGLVLWNAISDDFDVVRRHYATLPVLPADPEHAGRLAEIGAKAIAELEATPTAHLWTPYAGYWVEALDTRVASDSLDGAASVVLSAVGLDRRWDELQAWYWRTMKSTGERPGTARGHEPPARGVKGGKRRHGTVARIG